MTPDAGKAVAYFRVSTDKQASLGYSLDAESCNAASAFQFKFHNARLNQGGEVSSFRRGDQISA